VWWQDEPFRNAPRRKLFSLSFYGSAGLTAGDQIANPDLNQVAAAKPAADCQIEQGTVTNAALAIEEEANSPNPFL
jgi:hypothetical protein